METDPEADIANGSGSLAPFKAKVTHAEHLGYTNNVTVSVLS